jgi:hypothetical protein
MTAHQTNDHPVDSTDRFNERFAFGKHSSIEDLDTIVFQVWDYDTLANDLIGVAAGTGGSRVQFHSVRSLSLLLYCAHYLS